MSSQFALFLGRTIELCQYEAKSLFADFDISLPDPQIAIVSNIDKDSALRLSELSGGIQKTAEVLGLVSSVDEAKATIIKDLAQQHKKEFSIFSQTEDIQSLQLSKELKSSPDLTGRLRFQEAKSRVGLSAAVLIHNNIHEYGVFKVEEKFYITKTIWAQNIDHWTEKDMDKPVRDRKKGMLPPKLARMMINFVSADIRNKADRRVFDPFCGTGTLLIEGLETGWKAVGADASQKTVFAAGQNLDWYVSTFKPESTEYALFAQDATQVKASDLRGAVDAIVTEPFLGKPQPQPHELPNIFKGLEKLFLGFLKNSTKILPSGGELVIVTPLVDTPQKQFSLEHVIDKSKAFGYLIVSGPLIYQREQTIVKRAIYHLKKQ